MSNLSVIPISWKEWKEPVQFVWWFLGFSLDINVSTQKYKRGNASHVTAKLQPSLGVRTSTESTDQNENQNPHLLVLNIPPIFSRNRIMAFFSCWSTQLAMIPWPVVMQRRGKGVGMESNNVIYMSFRILIYKNSGQTLCWLGYFP